MWLAQFWFQLVFNYRHHRYSSCFPQLSWQTGTKKSGDGCQTSKLHVWPVRLWHYIHILNQAVPQSRNLLLIHGNIQYTEKLACFCSSQSLLCNRHKHLFSAQILVFVDWNSIQHMFFSNSVVMDKAEMNIVWSQTELSQNTYGKSPRRDENEGYCALVFV